MEHLYLPAIPPAGCLGFSKPQAPKQNKALEAKQMQLMQAQLEQAKKGMEVPSIAIPPPAPPPPPPPSSSSADVQEAQTDARRTASRRSGIQSTILAGETGGYKSLGGGSGSTILG